MRNVLIAFFLVIYNYNLHSYCILHSYFEPINKKWIDNYDCNKEILNQIYSSGSLFKIFIVSAGFYFNILQEKDIPYINQQMFESKNDYFKNLVKKIQNQRMIQYLHQELKEYFVNKAISKNDFKDDFSFVHGGTLKFYPEEIHNWFKNFALSQDKHIKLALETIKRNEQNIIYYGKSGTWSSAAWFCGIIELEYKHVICTLNLYEKQWKQAKLKSENDFLNKLKEIKK